MEDGGSGGSSGGGGGGGGGGNNSRTGTRAKKGYNALTDANKKKVDNDPATSVPAWERKDKICRRCGQVGHFTSKCEVAKNPSERDAAGKALVAKYAEKRAAIKKARQSKIKQLLASQ